MRQQRSSRPTPSARHRGRRAQQGKAQPRAPSFWCMFLLALTVFTALNLYTYSHRRDKILNLEKRDDNDGRGSVAGSSTGQSETTAVTKPSAHANDRVRVAAEKDTESVLARRDAIELDSGSYPVKIHVVDTSSLVILDGDGGDDGVDDEELDSRDPVGDGVAGGGDADSRLSLSLPLGRNRPLQIRTRPASAKDSSQSQGADERNDNVHYANKIDNFLRWPNVSTPHSDGENGGGITFSDTVTNFPCSLTEADEIPGLILDNPSRDPKGFKQRQQKAWSSVGPCVISCSGMEEGGFQQQGGTRSVDAGKFEYCTRAIRACELYQECTHVLLPPGPPERTLETAETNLAGEGDPYAGFATLMHLAKTDGSLAGVQAAAVSASTGGGDGGRLGGWRGGVDGAFTLEGKPRTYYIVSFGGSGSKMLGGWLSERGKDMVKEVFHIHDPQPAKKLFAKEARRGVKPGRSGKGKDFRGYDFPEGEFPISGKTVDDVDSYRVVLIFKDPAESLVSRYFYNHCKNIRGADCGGSETDFPSLERYAEETEDRLHMETFYDNYCDPQTVKGSRNFPVICVNYHKMWDNTEALVQALGLPATEATKLPVRTESVRNDQTSARRGEPFTLAVRERLRNKHADLSEKIFEAPAVAVV